MTIRTVVHPDRDSGSDGGNNVSVTKLTFRIRTVGAPISRCFDARKDSEHQAATITRRFSIFFLSVLPAAVGRRSRCYCTIGANFRFAEYAQSRKRTMNVDFQRRQRELLTFGSNNSTCENRRVHTVSECFIRVHQSGETCHFPTNITYYAFVSVAVRKRLFIFFFFCYFLSRLNKNK